MTDRSKDRSIERGARHEAWGSSLGLLTCLFVFSGAAGLIDQVCFSKYLSYVVGASAEATSAVLSAFMFGLALGAHLAGRYARRVQNPLRAYAILEVSVAVFMALTPFGYSLLASAYSSIARMAPDSLAFLSVARWVSAMILVVLPTVAMGATLPLLSRLTEPLGRKRSLAVGILYTANTFGGALGCLGATYGLLPILGLSRTAWVSALLSVTVGAIAWVASRKASETSLTAVTSGVSSPASPSGEFVWIGADRVLALAAFASGAIVFSCEVVFVHLLVLLVGSSAYAFGVVIATFLVFLSIGAALAPVLVRAFGRGALAIAFAGSAVGLAATLPFWERLPDFFQGAGANVTTFAGRELIRVTSAAFVLAIPTTLMGLTFPSVLSLSAARTQAAERVGRMTAINTVGSVIGALGAGYVILPSFGSQRALVLLSLVYASVAILALFPIGFAARREKVGTVAALTMVAGLFFGLSSQRPWDLGHMTSGFNVYFDWGRDAENIVFVSEDTHGGVTTVEEKRGEHTLLTNGKFQGNDGTEMVAQRYFAHYPGVFLKNFDRALVIGLGTGTTLGTVAHYPFRHIEVAEISPSIVEAARRFFGPGGADRLDDPRVALHLADGRNHLAVSDRSYDLIGIELTSVWFAGAASLYSRDFYRIVRSRLARGGVFQQWVQLHHISERDFASVLATLRAEFPNVALFYGGGQGILVATNGPLTASRAAVDRVEEGLGEGRPPRRLGSLVGDILVEQHGIDAFIADVAKRENLTHEDLMSTDDNLYLEYATPRGNVLGWSSREDLVKRLWSFRDARAISSVMQP